MRLSTNGKRDSKMRVSYFICSRVLESELQRHLVANVNLQPWMKHEHIDEEIIDSNKNIYNH